jgi:signal recognition particle GTPase
MLRTRSIAWTAGMVVLLALPDMALAQDPAMLQQQRMQEQVQRMQEHARQLTQAMEQMANVQQRAHQMEQQLVRAMEQHRLQRDVDVHIAERLRYEERLREMAHSMNVGAQEMHRAMEQLRNMVEQAEAPYRGDMEQEVERLRNHWELMTGSMEEGLRLLERLRDRVQASAPTGG